MNYNERLRSYVLFRLLTFNGLKLSKMGEIKDEVEKLGLSAKNCKFVVRFLVGNKFIVSNEFKIVSSFSQLPDDLKSKRNLRSVKLIDS